MSYTTFQAIAVYPADGDRTVFPIPDRFYSAVDIQVYNIVDGIETQVDPSDFAVQINFTEPTPPSRNGGDVVFSIAPAGGNIVVMIWPPNDQDQRFEGRPVTPRERERVHDRHSMRDAALRELFFRGFRSPLDTPPALRYIGVGAAGEVPQYDEKGNLIPGANIGDIAAIAAIVDQVNTVAGIDDEVVAVAGNATNINTVAGSIANVNAVGDNITRVLAVEANEANINAVHANATNINTVSGSIANVNTVATDLAGDNTIGTVAGSIADVETVAANIVAVQGASDNADAAAISADEAAASASNLAAVEDAAFNNRILYTDWATLDSVTGTAGDAAEVAPSDTGTHTGFAYGFETEQAGVQNAGVYIWDVTETAWRWVFGSSIIERAREAGVLIYNADESDLLRGDYIASPSLPSGGLLTTLRAKVLTGAGSVLLTPMVDGLAVADPIEVSAGSTYEAADLNVLVSQGDEVSFAVDKVSNVSSFWAQLDGGM